MSEEIEKSELKVEKAKRKPFKLLLNRKLLGILILILLIMGTGFYFKSIFVAAVVNGNPITRLTVIKELEKQGGKSTLESLVTESLIDNELKKNSISVTNEEIDLEIKNIETAVASQGSTLEQALLQQGMTLEILRKQVKTQKQIEKMLADKIQVSEEDVAKYIADNKIEVVKGAEIETKNQIAQQLRGQKLNQEAQAWITSLRASAKIDYYVTY